MLNKQWHLFNSGTPNVTPLRTLWTTAPNVDIGAPEAWELAHDASEITVAVIDGGFNINHPDLINNLWRNPGEIAAMIKMTTGISSKTTSMAGTSQPILLNYRLTTTVMAHMLRALLVRKAITTLGFRRGLGHPDDVSGRVQWRRRGSDQAISDAIEYAVDNGAKVINLSLGGNEKYSTKELEALYANSQTQEVLQKAYDQDVFIAIAAGNEGDEYQNKNNWDNIGDLDIYSTSRATSATAWEHCLGWLHKR